VKSNRNCLTASTRRSCRMTFAASRRMRTRRSLLIFGNRRCGGPRLEMFTIEESRESGPKSPKSPREPSSKLGPESCRNCRVETIKRAGFRNFCDSTSRTHPVHDKTGPHPVMATSNTASSRCLMATAFPDRSHERLHCDESTSPACHPETMRTASAITATPF
jgi:hypothetical protein